MDSVNLKTEVIQPTFIVIPIFDILQNQIFLTHMFLLADLFCIILACCTKLRTCRPAGSAKLERAFVNKLGSDIAATKEATGTVTKQEGNARGV